MIIKVRVIPNSKSESIEELEPMNYRIKVRAKAVDGMANDAAIEAISAHFKANRADVSIIRGMTRRDKVMKIDV